MTEYIQHLVTLILLTSTVYQLYRIHRPIEPPLTPRGRAAAGLVTTLVWMALLNLGGFWS